MDTPIADFLRRYQEADMVRLHMPGHKGKPFLGCEALDITEVSGADALYEARGIIARSEANATALFGSRRTLFSTEGSSQCIRAMVYLALTCRPDGASPVIVAARNVHRAFVYAAALLDVQVVWLWPEERRSLCACPVTPEGLEQTLSSLDAPPAAVYLTSPDYLGGVADIAALSRICHRHGTVLAVDNAHGAYLRFLPDSRHPLDLGADLCCDSAHKTLPVLTGGAYLHIKASETMAARAKTAMALFGSTSPSYLTMASLDLCNRYLAEEGRNEMAETAERMARLRTLMAARGWSMEDSDPLRLTIAAPEGCSGTMLAERLRHGGVECEYADRDHLVLMATAQNDPADFDRLLAALGENHAPARTPVRLPLAKGEQVCSIREALFAPRETVPAEKALGRVCGAPTVACPPAIPIAVSGEVIGTEALALLRYYGVETVDVLK